MKGYLFLYFSTLTFIEIDILVYFLINQYYLVSSYILIVEKSYMHEIDDFLSLDLGFASWQNDDRISRSRRPSQRCRISSPRIPTGLSLSRPHSELLGPRKLQPGIKIWEGHRSSQVCKLLTSFFQLRNHVFLFVCSHVSAANKYDKKIVWNW